MKTLAIIVVILRILPVQAATGPEDYTALQAHSAAQERKYAPYVQCMQDGFRNWQTMTQEQRVSQARTCRAAR